jgi:hypothetical protein
MRKSTQLLAAVAVAGMAVAGSTAFTGTGLASNAGESQFIGGTVSQSVSGATLSNVVYGFTDGSATAVDTIDLQFADGADTHSVTVATTSGNSGQGTFTCTAIGAVTAGFSHCTYSIPASGFIGLDSLAITVGDVVDPG